MHFHKKLGKRGGTGKIQNHKCRALRSLRNIRMSCSRRLQDSDLARLIVHKSGPFRLNIDENYTISTGLFIHNGLHRHVA